MLSYDLKYFTSLLFLYHPYFKLPRYEKDYPYNINEYDIIYSRYISICYEKVYNFWERIAILIYSFYPDIFKEKEKVYFSKVIDKLDDLKIDNDNLKWLIIFKNSKYKNMNDERIKIVHFNQYGSLNIDEYLKTLNGKNNFNDWKEKKNSFPEYFRLHLNLEIEGYKQTLAFTNSIYENK